LSLYDLPVIFIRVQWWQTLSAMALAATSSPNTFAHPPIPTVVVMMVERCPYRVALDGRKLEHFLSRTEFEKASEGWYYSSSKRSALIKYDNPKKDAELLVSFEDLDLIGM
jgi:hypothetical protein